MSTTQVNRLICAYLKGLQEAPGSGYDKDALALALSCVRDALKVDEGVPASDILEKVVAEGLKSVDLPEGLKCTTCADEETVKRAEVLKNEGNELFKAGNYNGAIAKFSDSIAQNPLSATYSNRSLCYMKVSRFDKAEEDARSAIRLDGKFARGYLRLSAALEAQNRIPEAVEVLKDLVSFAPEYTRDLEQMQAKMDANDSTSASIPPSGMPAGLPNIPGMEELFKDPEVQQLMMNPKFAKMAEDVKTGGIGAATKYMMDPELAPLLQKLTSKLLGGGSLGNFANMFGGNGHI